MAKRQHQLATMAARASGTSPLVLRVLKSEGNQALVEVGINYSLAEVPQRAYYADYCDVLRARVGFSLFFGKLIPGTDRLRTKIEVAFPSDMFRIQLWGSTRILHQAIKQVAERQGLGPIGQIEDTDKVQTFRSNNVFVGTWGDEAVCDFYYISARDLYILQTNSRWQANLEPVVRIVMATSLLFEFLEKCGPFAEETPTVALQATGGEHT